MNECPLRMDIMGHQIASQGGYRAAIELGNNNEDNNNCLLTVVVQSKTTTERLLLRFTPSQLFTSTNFSSLSSRDYSIGPTCALLLAAIHLLGRAATRR